MTRAIKTRSPRVAAAQAVERAWRGAQYVHEYLDEWRENCGIDARAVAQAQNLAFAVLRRHDTLDAVLAALARYEPRRVPRATRAVLHVATAEMTLFESAPPFAVVNDAVDATRTLVSPAAAKMVNAVLRRIAEGIVDRSANWTPTARDCIRVDWTRGCRFATPILPDEAADEATRIGAATGLGAALAAEWIAAYGIAAATDAAWASTATPSTALWRNPRRISSDEFGRRVRTELGADADLREDAAFVRAGARLAASALLRSGLVFVQDRTAHEVAAFVAQQPGERVLDYCAAPGGKTAALAFAAPNAHIVAAERDAGRRVRLIENLERLGLTELPVHAVDNDGSLHGVAGAAFDAVLIDVPCSNSGVLARRPEARYRLQKEGRAGLRRLQAEILGSTARMVAPGGRLIYSTCSILRDENRGVLDEFLCAAGDWSLEVERVTLPGWGPTAADWRDGGYSARLRRRT